MQNRWNRAPLNTTCVLSGALVLAVTLSCSKGSSSSPTTTVLRHAVAPLGITTPTAHTATTISSSSSLLPSAEAASLKTFAEFGTSYAARLESASVADAVAGYRLLALNGPTVNCYGPSISLFSNHPDGACGGSCSIPSGDLGIWVATQGVNDEACSAAKMNSIVAQLQNMTTNGLILMAGVNVAVRLKGAAMPAAGESVDVTTEMATAITAFTVTSATLANATTGVDSVYVTTITGTSSGNPISMVLKHSPTSADNTTYKGIYYGYLPQGSSGAMAYSLTYERTTSAVTFFLKSGQTDAGSFDASGMLNASGALDFSSTTFGQNGYRTLVQIDPTTNLGTAYLAWQAGKLDGATRVFQVNTSSSGGVSSGVSYFGFGDAITTSDGSITKMICNWAGPNNNHTGLSNKAQAQLIQLNTTSGVFTPTTNFITYVNTNNCNNVGSYEMSQPPGQSPVSGGGTAAVGTVTNDLVTYGSQGAIPAVTIPTVSF